MKRWKRLTVALTTAFAALGVAHAALAAPKPEGAARPARAAAPCTAIGFGAAGTAASISAAAEVDCYTFTGAIGDRIRIHVVETSGALIAEHAVLRPSTS